MVQELSVVGKRVPRWGAQDKTTGTAQYVVDIELPGMLVGKVLASPHPHARIIKIDKSKAEKLPGVEAVLTFEDIPKKLFTPNRHDLILYHPENERKDMYVISEKARFVGDRVAAVAAVDAATAQKALELIEVKYEVLPAVLDPVEAMKPGAPRVHDFAPNNISLHVNFPGSRGDAEKGFREAECVIEETFRTSKQLVSQLEPCACVASSGPDGRLTIWSPGQNAFLQRRKVAEIFGMPEGMIRWITPHVGGSFGKFGALSVEPICAALAKKAGKPVKIEYSREEDFCRTETRQTYVATAKMGVKKDGTITALQEKLIVDGGAYFSRNSTTTMVNMGAFTGLYRCPNVAAEADCVYTNVLTTGGIRGYGNSEAMSVLEHLMDKAAKEIGMDPIELRIRNIKRVGDPDNKGLPMETCTLEELMKLGAEKIGWAKKRAQKKENGTKRYGIGMAIMMDVSGAHPSCIQHRNALIKFNEDGSASLIVTAYDMGQNLSGTCAQIAAEVLGIRYEDIHIVNGDTDSTMFDTGIGASAGLYQVGHAVMNAAQEAKRRLLDRAGKRLGVAFDELEIKDGRIYIKSDSRRGISVAEVTKQAIYDFEGGHLNISGKGSFSPTQNPPPFAAVFAEVEVDIETAEVKILKILYVNDSGRVINPTTVEGQVEGGIAQGVGYCLTEDCVINRETGVLESDNFTTYKIPSTLDMPEIEVILYEEPVPSGPFGAKGVGHGTTIAVNPAIANAIYDAVGVFITDMPATPEKIWGALKRRQGTQTD
jgi:xanthine dehydrogenase molybdenum-binding subunit